MNKEELAKEAEEKYIKRLKQNGCNVEYKNETYIDGYLDSAEPREKRIIELEQQIEKMKCCLNCKYRYCGGSSVSIDKDGNKTYHNWNKEKQEYCDTGKNGKYQCWELAE